MNFYFCETCGKRVTERDIEQGAARNKKLKGIYCVSCAAGVNTMEMMPVTDVALREEPAKTAFPVRATPAVGIQGRLPVASDGVRLPGESASGRKSAVHHPQQASKPAANWMVLGIGACGLLTVAAAVLLTGGKTETKAVQSQKAPPAQSSEKGQDAMALPSRPLSPTTSPALKPEAPPAVSPAAPPADLAETRAKDPAIPDANPIIAPQPAPETSTIPPTPPATRPLVDDRPVVEPTKAAQVPQTTPPDPPQKPAAAPLTYQKFQDLVLGAESLADAQAAATASSTLLESAGKVSGAALAACVEQAASVEDAVKASLTKKNGSRIVLIRADGTRQFVDIAEDGKGGLNVRADELGLVQIQEFVREQLAAAKDADARIAAFITLRGDPEIARRLIAALDADVRSTLEPIAVARQARLREPKAAAEIKKFNELKARNSFASALTLGNQILKNYAGCKALAELDPPLEAQLAELQSGSMELRGIFLCGAKRLADGRIELNFDLKNPLHLLEFVNRSLPGWFTEIECDMTMANDGRWDRYIRLGDAVVTHTHEGVQAIDHLGKHTQQEVVKKADFANVAAHRYRIKAGPAGISFQVDDAPALLAPGAWGGGRLKWPGQYEPLPLALKVVGRADAQWLAEMAEVAKDRAKFMAGGAGVELKPRPRAMPRPEVEPEMIGWSINPSKEKEVRGLAGWNEVGPSWTTDGAEYISPKPKDKTLDRWTSVFWPQALLAPDAELAFEARVDAGQLDVLLPSERPPGQFSANSGYVFAVISNDAIQVRGLGIYGDRPGVRTEGAVQAEFKRTVQPGQWCKYQILYVKGSVAIFADGKQVLETKIAPHAIWPMAFWVTNGQEYRVRNVKIRKLE